MAYWLFKTEPDAFSIEDLRRATHQTERWDGIRNYQARNFIRDRIEDGDRVFIYHSQCKPTGIVGLAQVVGNAYVDPAQFDNESPYYDVKANKANPRWYCVDIRFVEQFAKMLPLSRLKTEAQLSDLVLLKQGRLSIQPVTADEAAVLLKLTQ